MIQAQRSLVDVEVPKRGSVQVIQQTQHLQYLKPEEYSKWDELVDSSPQGSVLCRSWLLETLGGDIKILAYFSGKRLVAGIPLFFEHRLGFSICRMPKLVHTWGVVMEPLKGRRVATISREMHILSAFARELAKQKVFVQSFHPSLVNWLPFMWNGFRQTTYFGYAFDDLGRLDSMWEQMSCNVRQNIRKAQRNGIRIVLCDSELVASVAEKSFLRQQSSLPYSREYLRNFYTAASARGAGQCFAAVDEQGQVHATAFLVWDNRRAHYVAGGTDPTLRASGADSLLIWSLLNFAHERTQSFDFCGSVVKPIATFFRHFGAQLVPYYRISKVPRALRILHP
jgi:hypothetical protein